MAPYVTGMGATDGATAPPDGASVGYPLELKNQVMKPMEGLRSATMFHAELFRLADRIGSVEPGKNADLLAIVKGAAFVKRAP